MVSEIEDETDARYGDGGRCTRNRHDARARNRQRGPGARPGKVSDAERQAGRAGPVLAALLVASRTPALLVALLSPALALVVVRIAAV